ncbi:serine hydrolase [Cytophagaceae bacterium ABcell3]|nr:serine hydrolase [Cytophagaceae bacterium ABcell3]
MSILKKVLLALLGGFIVLNLYILLSGQSYIYHAIVSPGPELDDYKLFYQRAIAASPNAQEWPLSLHYNEQTLSNKLRKTLKENKSVSFLVIKNDSILHEEYFDGYGTSSLFSSASVAKAYVSTLVGIAITEGYIESVEEPVANYLPSFKDEGKKNITIKHLLQMSSGLKWEASPVDPFSHTVEAYYVNDLRKMVDDMEPAYEPGQYYRYSDGDALALGLVVCEATGKKLSKLMESYFWHPQLIADSASWSLEKAGGMEKAFCCLNMTTRGFAYLGNLYLHQGIVKGSHVLDSAFIEAATAPSNLKKREDPDTRVDFFGYVWRPFTHESLGNLFYASGFLGQKIIVVPSQKMILVNIGNQNSDQVNNHPEDLYVILDEVAKMF